MITDDIKNHYETMVMDYLSSLPVYAQRQDDQAFLQDVVCVALNQLPPKYVRHTIDLVFYMTVPELQEMENRVRNAVDSAIETVTAHLEGPRRGT